MSVVDTHIPDQTSPSPPVPGRGSLFAVVLQGAHRQWPLAAVAGIILGAVGGGAYYTTHPPKSTVTTTLHIDQPESNLFGDRMDTAPGRNEEYRRGQAAMLRTRRVLREVLKDKKVADTAFARINPDPAGWLETELKATVADGGLLRVSLTGENAEEMATILNAVTAAYLSQIVDAERNDLLAKDDELDKVLVAVEDRLRGQREVLRRLADQLRTSDTQALTLKQKLALEVFNGLWLELHRLDSELRKSRAEVEVLQARAEAAKTGRLPEQLVAEALAADPAVRAAATKVQDLQDSLDLAGKNAAPNASALNGLKADLKAAEARLAAVRAQQRDAAVNRVRETVLQQTAGGVREAEARVQVLQRQKADLTPEVEKRQQEADRIGVNSFELELKRAEMAEADAIVKRLRGERERIMIQVQTYKRRVSVIAPADAAEARPSSYRIPATAGLGLAGIAAGVFGVGLVESRRRRLVLASDLPRTLQLRTVGVVPDAPGLAVGPVTDLWAGKHGVLGSVVVESVNDIRALLLCGGVACQPKVVLLTSAAQGEGKTTLACLLAVSVAQTSKRTLLIDGDIRNPRVHERFGLAPCAGLSEVLRGEATLGQVIQDVPGTNLSLLPAGAGCPRVVRGLTSEGVRALLAPLRERYDLIILDSCPILPVPDGLILSKSVDATILVVRSGSSTEPVVREACERLASVRAHVVGGILNRLTMVRSRLRYPYASMSVTDAIASDEPSQLTV